VVSSRLGATWSSTEEYRHVPRTPASKKTRSATPSSGRRFARPSSRTEGARSPLRKRPSRPKSPKKKTYPKPYLGLLSGKQKRYLRGLAHNLEPLVTLGKAGVTAGVTKEIDRALLDHELIKLRFLREFPTEMAEALPLLESQLQAQVAGQVGHIVMLYRPHPKRPVILLPRPTSASHKDAADAPCEELDADSEPDSPED
jgi:RNA-binding protein